MLPVLIMKSNFPQKTNQGLFTLDRSLGKLQQSTGCNAAVQHRFGLGGSVAQTSERSS